VITTQNKPWPDEFKTNGQNYVKKSGTGKVTFTSTFPLGGPGAECVFEAAKVKSLFVPGGEGAPAAVNLTTTEQIFKKNKKASNELCPATGKLSGTWTTSAGGEQLLSEVHK
jgi:hypothetical protein